jgi:hypothetical protein
MSNNCPSINLPIQIEDKYNFETNLCDNINSNCNIEPNFLSQGTFQNKCVKDIIKTPKLELAIISNTFKDVTVDSKIILNQVYINWCEFCNLFFTINNAFYLNPSNVTNCYLNFNAQTYENVTSKCIRLNLADQVKQAWATKCETSINNMPIKTQILLNKDSFKVSGLGSSLSTVSLTLDQAIETLLSNGQIAPADKNIEANVKFIIVYKYYFKPLNTCVEIDFVFVTKIPCYKNLHDCSPYSNDNNCRNCLDVVDEGSVLSFIKDNNFDYNNLFFDEDSTSDDTSSLYGLSVNDYDSIIDGEINLHSRELFSVNSSNSSNW